jgi:uncharacterized protein YjbI with pentapeptide repeats
VVVSHERITNTHTEPMSKTKKLFAFELLIVVSIGLILILAILSSVMPDKFSWTGFGSDSTISRSIEKTIQSGKVTNTKETTTTQFQSGKTLWDWLGLFATLAIPVVLFQFQRREQQRAALQAEAEKERVEQKAELEREIAAINLREEALQEYIYRISDLLLDKELKTLKANDPKREIALDIAQAITLSVLRRLDKDEKRKESIMRFLSDTELVKDLNLSSIDLSKTDLRGINMNSVKLEYANLNDANLTDTELSNTNLQGANLSGTKLSGANLSNAHLIHANLSNAELIGAELDSANLFCADLSDANIENANLNNTNLMGVEKVTPEQIKEARNWDKARYKAEFMEKLGLQSEL